MKELDNNNIKVRNVKNELFRNFFEGLSTVLRNKTLEDVYMNNFIPGSISPMLDISRSIMEELNERSG